MTTKLQRDATKRREELRAAALALKFAELPDDDPGRQAFKANAASTALIALPSKPLSFSPRELTSLVATLFGTADPELLQHDGLVYQDRQYERHLDVYGHSLSCFMGIGTRRGHSHDKIVGRLTSLLQYVGGQRCVEPESTSFFAGCIRDRRMRAEYCRMMGKRASRQKTPGIRPDILARRWPFAASPFGPSQEQIFDVKTIGHLGAYGRKFHVPPADQRARTVPTEYRALAVAASRKWCDTAVGDVGPFETFLATLPPVIGLGFGAYSEWSSEVDKLIGQMAELGGQHPERFGCCHGSQQARGPVAMWAKRHLHREVARETVRCRHQALDRILLRPSSSFAGDPEECRRADGGPDEPGIGNVFESADNRAAFSGSFYGHARGA